MVRQGPRSKTLAKPLQRVCIRMNPDFIILGNPISKKNSRPIHINRRTGRPMLGKSGKLQAAELDALYQIKQQMHDISEPLPIAYPLHIRFLFYKKTKARCDLSNLIEFPQDILQAAGVIENDYLIESLDGSRKFHDPEHPRTEIFVEKYEL